ncbi:MAG: hypothetical protein SPL62_05815 [Selenomonas sp.]|nr:hypothetical protein [Veillonellaceae bacterium]MDY6268893.1 hypothetical protein [Selenomonadaceae bacterium]MDY6349992.1 hypothetical protein [Selenomonas sp.]
MKQKIVKPDMYIIGANTKRLDSRTPDVAEKMKQLSMMLMKRNRKLYERLSTK